MDSWRDRDESNRGQERDVINHSSEPHEVPYALIEGNSSAGICYRAAGDAAADGNPCRLAAERAALDAAVAARDVIMFAQDDRRVGIHVRVDAVEHAFVDDGVGMFRFAPLPGVDME